MIATLPRGTKERARVVMTEISALLSTRTAQARALGRAVSEHYAEQAALIALVRSWAYGNETSQSELAAVSLLADKLRKRG